MFFYVPLMADSGKSQDDVHYADLHNEYYRYKKDFDNLTIAKKRLDEMTFEEMQQYFHSSEVVQEFIDKWMFNNRYQWDEYICSLTPKSSLSAFLMNERKFEWYYFGLKEKIKVPPPPNFLYFQSDQWYGTIGITKIEKERRETDTDDENSKREISVYLWLKNKRNNYIQNLLINSDNPLPAELTQSFICSIQYDKNIVLKTHQWIFTANVIDELILLPGFHADSETVMDAIMLQGDTHVVEKLTPYVDDVNKIVLWPLNESEFLEAKLLHVAVAIGTTGMVKAVLEAGADVNTKTEQGQTPLHIAAQCNNAPIVDLLLNAGCDPQAEDLFGFTPLALAKSEDVVKMLVPVTASSEIKNSQENWPVTLEKARQIVTIAERHQMQKSQNMGRHMFFQNDKVVEKCNRYKGYYAFLYPTGWIKVDGMTGDVEFFEIDGLVHNIDLTKILNEGNQKRQ